MTTREPAPGPDPSPDPSPDRDGDPGLDVERSPDLQQDARVRDLLRLLATPGGTTWTRADVPAGDRNADPDDHDLARVPMPPEVLARLQSGLAAESAARPGPAARTERTEPVKPVAPVEPVEAAPRRRGARRPTPVPHRRGALAAAAAVVVLAGAAGVAATTHLRGAGSDAGSSASAGSAVRSLPSESPSHGTPGSPSSPGTDASGGLGATPGPATSAPSDTGATGTAGLPVLPVLSRASFARDVTALLRSPTPGSVLSGAGTGSGARRAPDPGSGPTSGPSSAPGATPTAASTPAPRSPAPGAAGSAAPTSPYAGCTPPRTTPGSDLRAVRLDGSPAVLVLGPVLDGGRVATAWSCSGREPLLSARVTSPR